MICASKRFTEKDICISTLFEAQATRTPKGVAAIYEGENISYRELSLRSNQLATYLRRKGVARQDRVGLSMNRSIDVIVGVLGILKAGCVCVPFEPSEPFDRLKALLEDSNVKLIVTQTHFLGMLSYLGVPIVAADKNFHIHRQFDNFRPINSVGANDLAFIFGTSGSTGRPKGVILSHGVCVNSLPWVNERFGLSDQDRHLFKTSIGFVSLLRQIVWPLLSGGCIVIVPSGKEQDISYQIELIHKMKVTIITLMPSVLNVMLKDSRISLCKSLRHVICGADKISEGLRARFFDFLKAELHNIYAMSEAPLVTHWQCERNEHGNSPIGRRIPGMAVYLLDPYFYPTRRGEIGEVYVAGEIASGYVDSDLTSRRFLPNGLSKDNYSLMYKTGDLARYGEDGATLEYIGRADSEVKLRGYRIELQEVEAAIGRHPDIEQVAIIIRKDQAGQKRLSAYIVPVEGISPNLNELRSFLRPMLPEYMLPSIFVQMETLPLTSSGKIDRINLPNLNNIREVSKTTFREPGTEMEKIIGRIWQTILRVEEVSANETFFDLGGDSLSGMEASICLEKETGCHLQPAEIMLEPIERLAKICQERMSQVRPS